MFDRVWNTTTFLLLLVNKKRKHNVLIGMKIRKICQNYHLRNQLFE